MSFQAYLDTIREKTGKGPDDFRELARQRGLLRADVKAGDVVRWLKSEFGLGHGHSMAVYSVLRSALAPPETDDERIARHFAGRRAKWNAVYARIAGAARGFGADVSTKAGDSYITLLRGGTKFAIVATGVAFLDLGLKLRTQPRPNPRLENAGDWNAMVSHRVRLLSPDDLDADVMAWLRAAYEAAGQSRPAQRRR